MANLAPTSAPAIPVAAGDSPVNVGQGKDAIISEAPQMVQQIPLPPGQSIVSREEKVEYRDQDGNLLDPEQVKSLEGKVSFQTRYETRTRLIDAAGNEIKQPDEVPVAPPHPDVDNVDRDTFGVQEPIAKSSPAVQRDVTADELKEESIEKKKTGSAKPASDGNEATSS